MNFEIRNNLIRHRRFLLSPSILFLILVFFWVLTYFWGTKEVHQDYVKLSRIGLPPQYRLLEDRRPDDVHTPLFPSLEGWADSQRGLYLAVLEEMDQQFARLFQRIQNDAILRENTLILICSDNGPEENAGSAGPFTGLKATLFEGGIRSPLIVWGPGWIPKEQQGTLNKSSVFAAIDLVPSLLHLAGVSVLEEVIFDGENLAETLIGKSTDSRSAPLFFRRPPDRKDFRSFKNLPDLAVREGKWKLLCDYGGKRPRLYNLERDPAESTNLADQHPQLTSRLIAAVLKWNQSMPVDAGDPSFGMKTKAKHKSD
ncbi:sulfatase [Gimesia aquarii]|uniref:Choline-sulfatase n=1 Tax=Gimesia aquarii TaxID=2527964 RepID=A0A517WSZ8_9PLAN|nr:sulfatase-like hydrolase/transferase [Gimesia aquarii]QDU08374.1 Choline-sulfatase [Gimesia aquarii]